MRLVLLLAVICLMVHHGQPAYAQSKSMPLARVGPWEMNYDVDSCHLRAVFGTGDHQLAMDLTRVAPSDSFDLSFYGKKLATDNLRTNVQIGFGQQIMTKRTALSGTSGDRKTPLLIMSNLRIDGQDSPPSDGSAVRQITPEDETAIDSISFRLPPFRQYRLETGPLGAPLKALRKCTANLVRSWGYDPDVQSKLTRYAATVGNSADWFKPSDYPGGALQNGQSGRLTFRLDVDETGKVGGCRVLYRVATDDFANLTCKLLLKRAVMTSALDQAGKPVKSYYIRSVNWLMSQ